MVHPKEKFYVYLGGLLLIIITVATIVTMLY